MTGMTEKLFGILVREHQEMLMCYLISMLGERTLAEDLAQDAFLIAYRKTCEEDEIRDFGALLRGIARNLVMSERRTLARMRFVELEHVGATLDEVMATGHASPDENWDTRKQAVQSCIKKLGADIQQVVNLHYSANLNAATIGKRVGKSAVAIWQTLTRARKALKICIDENAVKQ